jgi:hypothetical protein
MFLWLLRRLMGTNSKIAVAALLTVAIAACSSEEVQQSSTPVPTNMPTITKKVATQAFNNPVVSDRKAQLGTFTTPSLIQPTNVTERVSVVSKGRTDPFAQIIGQYPVSLPSVPVTPKTVPVLPHLRISMVSKPQTQGATGTTTRGTIGSQQKNANPSLSLTRPVLPKVLPQVIPNQTLLSVLPPPPQPELAKAVLVTGVVQVGQEPQAIIKVPNEPTSRYVQAGQQLASGLLVKRIEMNEGSEPVVILEQYGIEVAKTVGEAPANSKSSSTSSTAANPV